MALQLALGCSSGVHRNCCCPIIDCHITGGFLYYDVALADDAYIEKWCGYVQTIIPLSPVNGSDSIAADATCVYFLNATKGTCIVRKSCQDPTCTCGSDAGFLEVELVQIPGTLFTEDTSGTYYGLVGGTNCLWQITRDTADACYQWRLERKVVPFVGIRLVLVVLINCSSSQVVQVFDANYCIGDTIYHFGPFFDGTEFTFTILAT